MNDELLMRPIPMVQFHIERWNGRGAPIYWKAGVYKLADGTIVNLPEVRTRKWHPRYWLLAWRVHRHGSWVVNDACPSGKAYEVYRGEMPNMATRNDVLAWALGEGDAA